jgi:hypothetical protein
MAGTSVTRHENAIRLPILRTALMYEMILRVPVRLLYHGLVFEAQEKVRRRVMGLCGSLERKPPSKLRDQKLAHLRSLVADLDRA